jgi:Fe-S cluster biogenesis protein NfuA
MSGTGEPSSYRDVLERIAMLAERLTASEDPQVALDAGELLDWVDAFHREGLGRLVELVRRECGDAVLAVVAGDEVAGLLLAAYGLGDDPEVMKDASQAVGRALEGFRATARAHGGSIELERVHDGVVSLRVSGSCEGCPSAATVLRPGIEAALDEHWPGFRRLQLSGAAPPDPSKRDWVCGLPIEGQAPRPVPVRLRPRTQR